MTEEHDRILLTTCMKLLQVLQQHGHSIGTTIPNLAVSHQSAEGIRRALGKRLLPELLPHMAVTTIERDALSLRVHAGYLYVIDPVGCAQLVEMLDVIQGRHWQKETVHSMDTPRSAAIVVPIEDQHARDDLRADAERYRWLRQYADLILGEVFQPVTIERDAAAQLDAMIDMRRKP